MMAGLSRNSRIRMVEHPQNRIPGGRLQRQLQCGETMQAMFGFRFEINREGVTAKLAGRKNLVMIQLHPHPVRNENNLAGGAIRAAGRISRR